MNCKPQIQYLHFDGGYISIKRAWNNRLNKLNETTKTGRERNIFIPVKVVDEIQKLLSIHPFPHDPENFLFWGEKKPQEKPAERKIFIKALFDTMQKIGIDEAERKRRNITFHSWRHFLNSLLINAKIPIQKVQSITGHLSERMTDLYYHPDIDDMADVRGIQENLFSLIEDSKTAPCTQSVEVLQCTG